MSCLAGASVGRGGGRGRALTAHPVRKERPLSWQSRLGVLAPPTPAPDTPLVQAQPQGPREARLGGTEPSLVPTRSGCAAKPLRFSQTGLPCVSVHSGNPCCLEPSCCRAFRFVSFCG